MYFCKGGYVISSNRFEENMLKKIFEMYTVKLQIVSTKLIIVCMYRAPSGK